jgi:predicted MPP superfamily phosphohydrolase
MSLAKLKEMDLVTYMTRSLFLVSCYAAVRIFELHLYDLTNSKFAVGWHGLWYRYVDDIRSFELLNPNEN